MYTSCQKNYSVLTYSTKSEKLITDKDFEESTYVKHHQKEFVFQRTPLESISVNMTSQIALDNMHLVDLGVMRNMLLRLLQNKTNFEISAKSVQNMFNKLESLKQHIPHEFVRRPRGLDEILHWKNFCYILVYWMKFTMNTYYYIVLADYYQHAPFWMKT